MRCELDLYIHLSNVRGRRLFYLLNGLAQIKQLVALLYSLHCSWVSHFIGVLLARCCLQMVATAKISPKTLQRRHPLYLLRVVQSIGHHCISRRCSSHMVRDAGIGWWRILMTMAHTKSCLRKTLLKSAYLTKGKRSWYYVFVGLTLLHSFFSSASGSLILCAPYNLHLSNCFFSIPLHWFSHVNNIIRNIFVILIIVLL